MRSFFRTVFKRYPHHFVPPSRYRTMSTASTSALLYAATVAAPSISAKHPDDELTKQKAWHSEKGGFNNPWPSWGFVGVLGLFKGMIMRKITGKANSPDTTPPTVPVQKPVFLPSREGSSKMRATWLGHACYYVEFPSGLRVLFDPVFTDRCSPISFLGPKRYTDLPCQIKDIPIIDAVVISHNHYDHLSHPTVMEISKTHPECQFFVPLGNKQWFTDCGIEKCTELDWWEEVDFTLTPSLPTEKRTSVTSTSASESAPNAAALRQRQQQHQPNTIKSRISAMPSQHMGNRGMFDRGATLWASWSIESNGQSLFFAGDTGYRTVPKSSDGKDDWAEEYADLPICPAFKDIGKFRGPFDLGLIPIGAYMPRWVMSPMHANPRDAVEIFRDTQCKRALGMHWGTWVLTEEDVLEPPRLLKEALKLHSIPEQGVFDVCDIGESREY